MGYREAMTKIIAYFWETIWKAASEVIPQAQVERLQIACQRKIDESEPPPGMPTPLHVAVPMAPGD